MQSAGGATYANVAALTIPASLIAGAAGTVTGVTTGSTTLVTTSAAHGLVVSDPVLVSGVAGVSGLNGIAAYVTAVPSSTSFRIAVATTGSWLSGGKVYRPTLATIRADAPGANGSAASRTITQAITSSPGVSVTNLAPFGARDALGNVAYAALCRLALGSRSPQGPSQAYAFFALTADTWLAAQSVTLAHGPIVAALVAGNSVTGQVEVTVASASPASTVLGGVVTPGCVDLPITNATNAAPIAITLSANHNLSSGDYVTVAGVEGNTAANGTWQCTVTGAASLTLDGSTGNAAYTAGTGAATGGDLGQVYRAVLAQANPSGTQLSIASALAFPVVVVASVDVPAAYAPGFAAKAQAAVRAYLAGLPVGGNDGTIPYLSVAGAITAAGVQVVGGESYVREVTSLTINGVSADVPYPTATSLALDAGITVVVRAV